MSFSVGVWRCGRSCRCDQGYRSSCCSEPERPRLLHGLRRLSHVRLGLVVAGNCASPLILRLSAASRRGTPTDESGRHHTHFEASLSNKRGTERRPIAAGSAWHPALPLAVLVGRASMPNATVCACFHTYPTTSVKLFLPGPWSLASTHCVQREHRPVAPDRTLLCA